MEKMNNAAPKDGRAIGALFDEENFLRIAVVRYNQEKKSWCNFLNHIVSKSEPKKWVDL